MLTGNREYAHVPLIIEAYKTVPAAKVALLLELAAFHASNNGNKLPFRLMQEIEVWLSEEDFMGLFQKAKTIVSIFHENDITIHPLKASTSIIDRGVPSLDYYRDLCIIQNTAFAQLGNQTDGAGISPTQYHTHHPMRVSKPGSSYPYAPQPLPEDRALVTVSWPSITHIQVEWGETVKELRTIPASEHSSGLYFSYENASKIQKLLADPRIKETGLVFGYAAAEPVRLLENGQALKGIAAHYPGDQRTRNIRKVMPTANGPAGGGL